MRIVLCLPVAAVLLALVSGCSSTEQAQSSVQLPGDAVKRPGLEVPPDAWEHPVAQTANAAAGR